MKTWYTIKNNASAAEVSIHDEIGAWGISAKDFLNELKSIPHAQPINLSIHSPGGEVFDGWAIYNNLKGRNVNVKIEGLAASMASVIAMAGTTISMPRNAMMMIHNPVGLALGESSDMRELADLLDKLRDGIANAYEARTGLPRDEIVAMMDAETWMNGDDALSHGFIDTVSDALAMSASAFDTRRFAKMPTNSTEPVTETEVVEAEQAPAEVVTTEEETKSEEAPVPEVEAEQAPQAKGIIARTLEAFTGSKKQSELITALRADLEAKTKEVESLTANLSELKAKADQITQLEAALVEAENASKTAGKKAAEIIAAAGFNPSTQGDLPSVDAGNASPTVLTRDEYNQLIPSARLDFVKRGGKLQD